MGVDEEWTALIFVFLEKIIVNLKSVFCIVTEFVCLYFNNKQKEGDPKVRLGYPLAYY